VTVKERIKKLKEDDFDVLSASMGKVKLLPNADCVRIIKDNDTLNPLQCIGVGDDMESDKFSNEKILNENVWTCHGVFVLDLNIS
jgi:hypothetical protein